MTYWKVEVRGPAQRLFGTQAMGLFRTEDEACNIAFALAKQARNQGVEGEMVAFNENRHESQTVYRVRARQSFELTTRKDEAPEITNRD